MCFQNGYPDQPEDEVEQRWVDPSDVTDGDMPWAPNPVEKPQPWEDWPEEMAGPEYWLYKRQERRDNDTDPEQ